MVYMESTRSSQCPGLLRLSVVALVLELLLLAMCDSASRAEYPGGDSWSRDSLIEVLKEADRPGIFEGRLHELSDWEEVSISFDAEEDADLKRSARSIRGLVADAITSSTAPVSPADLGELVEMSLKILSGSGTGNLAASLEVHDLLEGVANELVYNGSLSYAEQSAVAEKMCSLTDSLAIASLRILDDTETLQALRTVNGRLIDEARLWSQVFDRTSEEYGKEADSRSIRNVGRRAWMSPRGVDVERQEAQNAWVLVYRAEAEFRRLAVEFYRTKAEDDSLEFEVFAREEIERNADRYPIVFTFLIEDDLSVISTDKLISRRNLTVSQMRSYRRK